MKIKTKGLTKHFGDKTAVDSLDLEIKPGEILGLLGPNGAGKSTTIKMLTGQLAPTTGNIVIDDQNYSQIPDKLRGQIGVMPQEVIIWDDLNIEENLRFSGSIQNMSQKHINERVEFLIEGLKLSRELKTLARELSGGYKRRVNLAISIIHNPSLIFLDEPSPGVDAQTRIFLWEFIKSLRDDNNAIVLTDHYLDEAEKLSDYVVIIDQGKKIAEGTVQELKKKHGNSTALRIEIAGETPQGKIEQAIQDLPFPQENIKLLDQNINIYTDRGIDILQKVKMTLDQHKLTISNISLSEPTLEDVFISLTGKDIRE